MMGLLDTLGISKKTKSQLKNLNQLNKLAVALLAFQAILILIMANSAIGSRSITTSFLTTDPQTTDVNGQAVLAPAVHNLFDLNLAYLVAAILLISAVIRLLVATSGQKTYEKELKKSFSRSRWFEFALVNGLVMVALAIVSGVSDASALLLILALVGFAGFLNYLREINPDIGKLNSWLRLWGGVKAALIPWLVVGIYVWGARAYGSGLPAYIYWLDGSLLVLFLAWAWLDFQISYKRGRWADYLNVEQGYIILSLITTALLTWQIYAGTLR
jgi:Heliorhodopsin